MQIIIYIYLNKIITIVVGEITTLEHELRNNSVEARVGESESLLASAQSTEILSSFWYYIRTKLKRDLLHIKINKGKFIKYIIIEIY